MKKRTMALTVFMAMLAGLGILDGVELIWKWAAIKADGVYIATIGSGLICSIIGAAAAAVLCMIWTTWAEDDLTDATSEGFARAWDMIREELERMKEK